MLGTHAIKFIEGIHIEFSKCPFCGSDPEWVIVPGEDYIMRCSLCHASTPKARMAPEQAAADWNTGNVVDDHFTIPEDTPIDDFLLKGIQKVFFSEYSNFDKYPDIENGFLCSEMIIVTEDQILFVDPLEDTLRYDEITGYNPNYYQKPLGDEGEPIRFVRSEWIDGSLRSLVLRCGEKEYVVRADQEYECMAVKTSGNALSDNPYAEWLFLSDDGCFLSLHPYVGKAWEVGKQIQALYYPQNRPYMNGYCWSSIVRYYLKSIDLSHLLCDIEMFPKEHVCVFRAKNSNAGSVRQLSDILRKDVTLLPGWIKKSQLDEWDDWG